MSSLRPASSASTPAGSTILPPIDPGRQRVFQQLKPPCVGLSRVALSPKPDARELIKALVTLYETLLHLTSTDGHSFDPKIGEYVFFPLSHVLRRHDTINDRAIELTLQCLELLLKNAWRTTITDELGQQLLILVTFIIGGSPADTAGTAGVGNRSEETKLAGCRCLQALLESLKRSGSRMLETTESLPAVAHSVTTLLETLEAGDMVELQIEAIGTVRTLLLDAIRDLDMKASFYPGVMSAMVKATGRGATSRRPYLVLREVVKLTEKVVVSIMGDQVTTLLPEDADTHNNGEGKVTKTVRTKGWLQLTATNTKAAIEQLLKLRTHPKVEVRTAIFEMSRTLLEGCRESLHGLMDSLVESLIVISGDEDLDLASLARNTLAVMAAINEPLKDAVRNCLDKWISNLPRVMTGNDEDAKGRVISRLSLTFEICSELGIELELLRDMMTDSIKDSVGAVQSLVKRPLSQPHGPSSVKAGIELPTIHEVRARINDLRKQKFPDVMLPFRSQAGTAQSMKQLLSKLGRSSENALALAQRHLRDASSYGAPLKDRATSLWIAVNLARGPLQASNEMDMYIDFGLAESNSLQKCLTDELFSFALDHLSEPPQDDEHTLSFESSTLRCLALESLSLVAETYKRDFRPDLVEALYPVVHHLGDPSPLVQNHAIIALNNITYACEYESAQHLLLDNVDYMVNAVSLKLNIFDLSPQAPVVLKMMLQLAGPKLVPYLEDVVGTIFGILDGFHEYEKLCEGLFAVLAQIVDETTKEEIKLIHGPDDDKWENRHKTRKLMTDDALIDTLHAAKQKKIERKSFVAKDTLNDDSSFPRRPWKSKTPDKDSAPQPDPNDPLSFSDGDDDEAPPPPSEPETPAPPKSYQLLHRITQLTQHYLPTSSLSLRIRLLHLISKSSPALARSSTQFLPLINDLWPVLYSKLSDPEPAVVIQACDAIGAMMDAAGDFMSTRFDNAWPTIKRMYSKMEAERGRETGSGGLGKYGMKWKVWDALVRMLVRVVEGVGFREEVLDEIVAAVGGVLLERDDLRSALECVRGDAVWLEMMRRGQTRVEREEWERRLPRIEGEEFVIPVF